MKPDYVPDLSTLPDAPVESLTSARSADLREPRAGSGTPSLAQSLVVSEREPLQRGAPSNIMRHLGRAALRIAVLVAADLTTFYVLRWLRRQVDDLVPGGLELGRFVLDLFPQGYLNGWQFGVALLVGLAATGNYGPGDRRRDAARIYAGCCLAAALPLWSALWKVGVELVVFQFVTTSLVIGSAVLIQRRLLDRVVAKVMNHQGVSPRTIVIACTRHCQVFPTGNGTGGGDEFSVVQVLETQGRGDAAVKSRMRVLPEVIAWHRAEALAVCGHLSTEELQLAADAAMAAGCQFLMSPRAFDLSGVQPRVVWRHGKPVLELRAPALLGQQMVLKRAMDIAGSAVGLLALSPLLALVGLLVKVSSPGPMLFAQERVGQGGRRFRIWKFRTMVVNAEDLRGGLQSRSMYQDHRLFKDPDDPRITPLGRLLRRSSLDELPQLWNVLRGEMSLVGPRPPLPSEVAQYEARHYVRFDVKPGITGPWQVAGRNQITDFEKVVALEKAYIREWSLGKDLAILARTLVVVVRMKGAH